MLSTGCSSRPHPRRVRQAREVALHCAVSSPGCACGVQAICMEVLKLQRHLPISDRKTTLGLVERRGLSSPGCEPQTHPPLSTGRQWWQQDVQKLGAPSGTKPCSVQRETPRARPNLFWDHPTKTRCATGVLPAVGSFPGLPRPAGPVTSCFPRRSASPATPATPARAVWPRVPHSTDHQHRLRMTALTFQKRLVFKRVTLNSYSSL